MIRHLISVLLLSSVALAACTETSGKCEVGSGKTYSTIQACSNAMASGQTCLVYAGTYNEDVTVTAGSGNSYKTIEINGNDLVYVYSFSLNSYNKLIGGTTVNPCNDWDVVNCPSPTGLHIQHPASPSTNRCVTLATSSTNISITNTNMYACDSATRSMIGTTLLATSLSYITVRGNTLSYGCSTTTNINICKAVYIRGNRWLVEDNDISHMATVFNLDSGPADYNVIRNNRVHHSYSRDPGDATHPNGYYPIWGISVECFPGYSTTPDPTVSISGTNVTWISGATFGNLYPNVWVTFEGSSTKYYVYSVDYSTSHALVLKTAPGDSAGIVMHAGYGNCHSDFAGLQAPGTYGGAHFNLFEGNLITDFPGNDSKVILAQGSSSNDAIFRYNVIARFGSSGAMANNTGEGYTYFKTYHNTWIDLDHYPPVQKSFPIGNIYSNASIGSSNFNDLFYYPVSFITLGVSARPIACGGGTCSGTGALTGGTNLAFFLGASSPSCTQLKSPDNSTTFVSVWGNTCADPKFIDYANDNFFLDPASPAHLASGPLTTVNGTVTNDNLVMVFDSHFFWAGYGVTDGDYVGFGDAPLTFGCVQVVGNDVSTGILTLATKVTISNGAKVWPCRDTKGRWLLTSTTTQKSNIGGLPDSVSPSSIPFADQQTGTTSAAVTVTLSNWSTSTLAYTSAALSGTGAAQFSIATNNCSNPIPAASSCQMTITFHPAGAATYNASLDITDGASDSIQHVALSGTGIAAPTAPVINTFSSDLAYVKPGGHFTFTVATVGADIGCSAFAQTSGGNAQVIGPITCNGTFTWNPYDTYPLINFNEYFTVWMNALGSGGSTDSRTTGKYAIVYEQKWVSAGRKPF